MSNKNFFVTDIGENGEFDNVTILLSDISLHRVISALSTAMLHYDRGESPSRICITLNGMMRDEDPKQKVRDISFVVEAK